MQNRKTLINPSRVEWSDYTANPYIGCAHGCIYCYGRLMNKRCHWIEEWEKPMWDENIVALARAEKSKKRPGRIFIGDIGDAYQPVEETVQLTRRVLIELLNSWHEILILTKSDLISRDYDLFSDYPNVEVGFTITSLDLTSFKWEPLAPSFSRRVKALMQAKKQGLRTFVSIEPWIPNVTDPIEIVKHLKGIADRFIIGKLNYFGVPKRILL